MACESKKIVFYCKKFVDLVENIMLTPQKCKEKAIDPPSSCRKRVL